MRTYFYISVLCMLTVVLLTGSVSAQWEQNDRSKLGLAFESYFPSDSTVSDSVGSAWLGPVLSYNLTFDKLDRPSSYVSIGVVAKDGNSGGYDGSLIPLTYARLKRYGDAESSWYAGAGAGLYFSKFKLHNDTPGSDSSATDFGIQLIGGRELGKWFFAELKYALTTRNAEIKTSATTSDNVSMSGLSARIGIRGAF